jgi:membrane protein DedA with SNARE-associated domain
VKGPLTTPPGGYFLLFALLTLGIAGIPLPDEIMLSLVGYHCACGKLHLLPTILAAALGSSCGLTISYLIGRVLGYPLVVKYGRYLHITAEKLDRAHNWFQRGGKWTLILSIFIPTVRHVLAIAAGTSKMSIRLFGFFAYAGALLWTSTFIMLGYFAGREADRLKLTERVRIYIMVGIAVFAALVGIYILLRGIRLKRHPAPPATPQA